ncbi:MAG: hypothetical protein ACYTDU_02795 [Planctomycetota bacterium]
MTRAVVLVVLALLLALAHPVESMLRADAPPAPASQRIGAGRLLGSVLTGPFRPLLLTYLWIRSDILYGEARYDEAHQLVRVMVSLYPNNERPREFLGWLLAFNFKSEAPSDALGWMWAKEGLDILVDTDAGRSTAADWIRKQCGQNSLYEQRYAGPAWSREKAWRAGLRAWGARRYGVELSRFALGLRVLEGRDGFRDRLRRAALLESLAYEEFLRHGRAADAADAVAALKEAGLETSDYPDPGLSAHFFARARTLDALAAGRLPRRVDYAAAVALWGIGAHARNAEHLDAARTILRGLDADRYAEELLGIERWVAYVGDPDAMPRPSLPFDGRP